MFAHHPSLLRLPTHQLVQLERLKSIFKVRFSSSLSLICCPELLDRMKTSASLVEPFARETHSLLQHVQVRVKECSLYMAAILLCDSGWAVLPEKVPIGQSWGWYSAKPAKRYCLSLLSRDSLLPIIISIYSLPPPLAHSSPSRLTVFILWLSTRALSSRCDLQAQHQGIAPAAWSFSHLTSCSAGCKELGCLGR